MNWIRKPSVSRREEAGAEQVRRWSPATLAVDAIGRWPAQRLGTGAFVVGVVFLFAVVVRTGGLSAPLGDPALVYRGFWAAVLTAAALAAVVVFARRGSRRGAPVSWLSVPRWGGRPDRTVYVAPAVVATWLGAMAVTWALGRWSEARPAYNDLPADPDPATVGWAFVALVVLGPILEELFYRGCVQSFFRRRLPAWASIGVTTAVFLAMHTAGPLGYGAPDLLAIAVLSVSAGLLFEAIGGVWPPVLAHAAWNLHVLLVWVAQPPLPVLLVVPAGGVAVAMRVWRRQRHDVKLAALWEQASKNPIRGQWGVSEVRAGRVVSHRQRAQHGTKAAVRWHGSRRASPTWFKGAWPPVKSWVLALGGPGHGPHHNERVFYVHLVQVVPGNAEVAYRRHQRRVASRRLRESREATRPRGPRRFLNTK